MAKLEIIDYFVKLDLPEPVDILINQINDLIHRGILKPGDRLPSEKNFENKLNIPRGQIHKALIKLETYGILKTIPQNGTYVAKIGVEALEGILSNILKLEEKDFNALVETRCVLEMYAAELAAEKVTEEEIEELEKILSDLDKKIKNKDVDFDMDMVFHLKIAKLSKNSVLKSILTLLISDIILLFKDFEKKTDKNEIIERLSHAAYEHKAIIDAIKKRDPKEASKMMQKHFRHSSEFRDKVLNSGGI